MTRYEVTLVIKTHIVNLDEFMNRLIEEMDNTANITYGTTQYTVNQIQDVES